MWWYSANVVWAAAWYLSDHLSRPDRSSFWKSSSFLQSTNILVHWILCISSNFSRVLGATSTGDTTFAATVWATLMPFAIMIRIAIKFLTTTATYFLPEITLVYMFTTLKPWDKWSPSPPFQGVRHYMHIVSQVFVWPCMILEKKASISSLGCIDCLVQISQIHYLICGSFSLNQRSCLPTCQQWGYPWCIQRNQKTHQFHFPWSHWWPDWWWGVPRVTGTQDPKPVESGITMVPWLCFYPELLPPEPLWWCTPWAMRILLQNHLCSGCCWSGHSRIQCPKNKPQWTLGSPHWCLSHYPKQPNCSHHKSRPRLCSQVHCTN